MKKWKWDYIVDAEGGGDFLTIQEAIDAGGKNILVKPGIYKEQVDAR
jgi:pectin methylesterase-like acyl-CoA thioesterase